MHYEVLTHEHFRAMAWKNGGGTTLELYRLTAPECGDFAVRLSIADVHSSGPFSLFDQVNRQLLLLSGKGVELNFADGVKHTLNTPLQPFGFAGDVACESKLLAGPVQDFNLMVHRHFGNGALAAHTLSANETLKKSPAALTFCYVHTGEVYAQEIDNTVSAQQLLIVHDAETLTLTTHHGAIVIVADVSLGSE